MQLYEKLNRLERPESKRSFRDILSDNHQTETYLKL